MRSLLTFAFSSLDLPLAKNKGKPIIAKKIVGGKELDGSACFDSVIIRPIPANTNSITAVMRLAFMPFFPSHKFSCYNNPITAKIQVESR